VLISEAQSEIRRAYLGGSVGQAVSALLWLASAALAGWAGPAGAMATLVVGGVAIFPLTRLGLLLVGAPRVVTAGNPLNGLALQVAFVLPLSLPLVGAATLYRADWFYPAFMVALGAHYLPFVFLYGMRAFAVLTAALVLGGLALGLYLPLGFAAGGWITAALLAAFAAVSWAMTRGERASTASV
jgi:hypothetical protein